MINSVQKFIVRQISALKLKSGYYKKEVLPLYDYSTLIVRWPYENPHCVSDLFSHYNESDIDLSICIPAFNSEKSILRLLQQIERQRTEFKFEVLIVNDGSTDKTGSLVEGFIANSIIMKNNHNV